MTTIDKPIKPIVNRFDFEEHIMSCWGITSDLRELNEELLDGSLTTDDVSNIILGLEQLYEIRFKKLLRKFTEFVAHNNQENDWNKFMEQEYWKSNVPIYDEGGSIIGSIAKSSKEKSE